MPLQLYKIATVEVGSAGASSIAFSSIPQGYTDLKLVISARAASSGQNNITMKVNSLTSSIYSQRAVEGNGSAASSFTQSGVDTSVRIGVINGATDTSNTFSSTDLYIPNYAGNQNKSASADTVPENNATLSYMNMIAYLVSTTDAISSLTLNTPASFVQYSTATLYGIL